MQKNIVIIGGGESFSHPELYIEYLHNYRIEPWKEKKKWKTCLASKMVEGGWNVFMPQMPSPDNAHYNEWFIVFRKLLECIPDAEETIFVGHSLGGCFLLRALSDLRIPCSQLHTIAACVRAGDFTSPNDNWNYLRSLGNKVHLWHSEDDCIVPFSDAQFLLEHLPDANPHFYMNMSHFHKLEEFTDLEKCIGIT